MEAIEKIKQARQKEVFLGEDGRYKYIEKQYKADKNNLTYSHYIIKYRNKPIMVFQVPKPFGKTHPVGTTAFLHYQDSVRDLMAEIFEILTGKKESVSGRYRQRDAMNLISKTNDTTTAIFLKDIDCQVGAISLGDKDINIKLTQNFIDSFEKKECIYDWKDIKVIE